MSDSNMQEEHFIGVDVGTGSARACITDSKGVIRAIATQDIETWKPKQGYYEQSTQNIWSAICHCVRTILSESRVDPLSVKGLGMDATCSLAVLSRDTDDPISVSPSPPTITPASPPSATSSISGKNENNNIVQNIILWLDHRAASETATINATNHNLLKYVGGAMNIEMELPKVLWLRRHLPPEVFARAKFYDLVDALTHLATGTETRGLSGAVCKQGYVPVGVDGSVKGWQEDFYRDVGLGSLVENDYRQIGGVDGVNGHFLSAGDLVGTLSEKASQELGLHTGVAVGAGVIDAYAGWISTVGASVPDLPSSSTGDDLSQASTRLAAVAGTSTCHLVLSPTPVFVPGVWGPYRDVTIPTLWMAEGGQSATGELLRHVVETHPAYLTGAAKPPAGTSPYDFLNAHLEAMRRGRSAPSIGYLARHTFFYGDLWGNRSPVADPDMTGSLVGITPDTSVDGLAVAYYAAMEFIALQTRHIVESMNRAGHGIRSIFMSGSQCKNPLLMRLISTACGMPVVLPEYASAAVVHGAAMLGARAAGGSCREARGRLEDLWSIMRRMGRAKEVVWPDEDKFEKQLLEAKYKVFLDMCKGQREYRKQVDEAIAGWDGGKKD